MGRGAQGAAQVPAGGREQVPRKGCFPRPCLPSPSPASLASGRQVYLQQPASSRTAPNPDFQVPARAPCPLSSAPPTRPPHTPSPALTGALGQSQDASALHPAVAREPELVPTGPGALHVRLKLHFLRATGAQPRRGSPEAAPGLSPARAGRPSEGLWGKARARSRTAKGARTEQVAPRPHAGRGEAEETRRGGAPHSSLLPPCSHRATRRAPRERPRARGPRSRTAGAPSPAPPGCSGQSPALAGLPPDVPTRETPPGGGAGSGRAGEGEAGRRAAQGYRETGPKRAESRPGAGAQGRAVGRGARPHRAASRVSHGRWAGPEDTRKLLPCSARGHL